MDAIRKEMHNSEHIYKRVELMHVLKQMKDHQERPYLSLGQLKIEVTNKNVVRWRANLHSFKPAATSACVR